MVWQLVCIPSARTWSDVSFHVPGTADDKAPCQ